MRATGTRPGSLTLFAVLNFILAGLACFGVLGDAITLVMAYAKHGNHEMRAALAAIPRAWLWTELVGDLVKAALLVVSGIGLLRQSVLWGRWAATAAAVVCLGLVIGGHIVGRHADPHASGMGQSLGLVFLAMGVLHPLLLLAWIHVVVADVWRPPRMPQPGGRDGVAHPFLLTAAQSLRQALRSASGPGFSFGTVLAGLVVCFSLLVGSFVATEFGEGTGFVRGAEQRTALLEKGTATMLGFILREKPPAATAGDGMIETPLAAPEPPPSERWARFLVRERPAGLSFCWLLLAVVLPLAVLFPAAGQIARDVGNRGFRFLLTRIDRDSIFLGRFAAAAALAAGVVVLTVAVCAVVMGLAEPEPAWGAIAAWAAWAATALVIASLPFVALGMLCSTVIGHSFGALCVAEGVIVGWPLVAFALAKAWEPLVHSIHVLPLAVQFGLFHPSPWVVAGSILACLLYTAGYLWLGRWHFRRRDL